MKRCLLVLFATAPLLLLSGCGLPGNSPNGVGATGAPVYHRPANIAGGR